MGTLGHARGRYIQQDDAAFIELLRSIVIMWIEHRGEFTVGNETYSVEPVDETLTGRHRVYKESDSTQPIHRCGM